MKSKLEQLKEEEKKLTDRLDQAIARKDATKAQMITDRLHTAGALSQRWAAQEIEINSLREALGQVRIQVEAEQEQTDAPAWQEGLYKE
jgi:hypothetical protein